VKEGGSGVGAELIAAVLRVFAEATSAGIRELQAAHYGTPEAVVTVSSHDTVPMGIWCGAHRLTAAIHDSTNYHAMESALTDAAGRGGPVLRRLLRRAAEPQSSATWMGKSVSGEGTPQQLAQYYAQQSLQGH
jgi:hypothetical protein